MTEATRSCKPVLVAVWPGMGQVAISAGYYLMAKLGMHVLAEFSSSELFDVDHVEVKNGLIRGGRLPRSRLFGWDDPNERQNLIVFIGEAQPPLGKYAFCRKLAETVKGLGVEQVFTFAAMATQMHPEHESRVFAAAIDDASLADLKARELEVLEDGHIGGLNGVLLGVAAEGGMRGACLLGEMPHIFVQLPFPRASLAVLDVFSKIVGIKVDLDELAEQAQAVDKELGELLERAERALGSPESGEKEERPFSPEPVDEGRLSAGDERHIEALFEQAHQDRSKAYELKRELDRLEVFKDYEDRLLDLFKTKD